MRPLVGATPVAPEVVKTLQPVLPFLFGRHGRTGSALLLYAPGSSGASENEQAGARKIYIVTHRADSRRTTQQASNGRASKSSEWDARIGNSRALLGRGT